MYLIIYFITFNAFWVKKNIVVLCAVHWFSGRQISAWNHMPFFLKFEEIFSRKNQYRMGLFRIKQINDFKLDYNEFESWVEPEYSDSKIHLNWVRQLNTHQVSAPLSHF